jgi:hypothetical protein
MKLIFLLASQSATMKFVENFGKYKVKIISKLNKLGFVFLIEYFMNQLLKYIEYIQDFLFVIINLFVKIVVPGFLTFNR